MQILDQKVMFSTQTKKKKNEKSCMGLKHSSGDVISIPTSIRISIRARDSKHLEEKQNYNNTLIRFSF